MPHLEMCNTNDGDQVVDTYAHLVSRDLVSQSAAATWCMLTQVVVLFVLHVNIMFVVYCTYVYVTWVVHIQHQTYDWSIKYSDAGIPVHDTARGHERSNEACNIDHYKRA